MGFNGHKPLNSTVIHNGLSQVAFLHLKMSTSFTQSTPPLNGAHLTLQSTMTSFMCTLISHSTLYTLVIIVLET